MKRRLLPVILVLSILISFFAVPTVDASAKTKKSDKKTSVSEEAAHFTIETWQPTYGNWTNKEIKAASDRGTGKNLFKEYKKFYETDLFNDKKFVQVCAAISQTTQKGYFGVLEDQKGEVVKYLQKNIKTIADVWAYFALTNYSYLEDAQGYMSSPIMGWTIMNDAKINITDNCGVCIETAGVVCYLLEDDYEETGFIMVTSDSGHAYNYVKSNGTYYLIDFTDMTTYEYFQEVTYYLHHKTGLEEIYKDFVNSICFWSGDSLNSASATKAVLIHDTYEENNHREKLNISYNEEHTGCINAIRYYSGNNGSCVSDLADYSYHTTILREKTWVEVYDNKTSKWVSYMPSFLGFSVPEYTWYQTMYVNETNKYCNTPWKELAPIELRLVPWYCDLSPEAQAIVDSQESYTEKMLRQTEFGQFVQFDEAIASKEETWGCQTNPYVYNQLYNTEVRWGLIDATMHSRCADDLPNYDNLAIFKSWYNILKEDYDFTTMYDGVELVKVK